MRHTASFRLSLLLLLFVGLGCSPTLVPLYRDYDAQPSPPASEDLRPALQEAFVETGWTVAEGNAPNVVTTSMRTFSKWGLYKVQVYLEAAPLEGGYVRVYIHPFRRFFTGTKSKIPYLRERLRRAILTDLNAALEARGLTVIGTAYDRDRALTRRRSSR